MHTHMEGQVPSMFSGITATAAFDETRMKTSTDGGVGGVISVEAIASRGAQTRGELIVIRLILLALIVLLCHDAYAHEKLVTEDGPYGGVSFVGDSITLRWPLAEYFRGAIYVGSLGATSCEMLARFDAVVARHPKVVVILAGTDDIRYYAEISTRCLDEMVEEALAARAKVIVGTLPSNTGWAPGTPQSYGDALYEVWNAEVLSGAKVYGYSVVDYFDATGGLHQDKALFISDGTHPNAAGYKVLSETLRPVLNKVLHD
jgi:GDSL-like Lipase/Acylhydrolase family